MMSSFQGGHYLPRLSGGTFWQPLLEHYGDSPEKIHELPFQLSQAEFHVAGPRVSDSCLRTWREELNEWAYDLGFPAPLNNERRSRWDVELGERLLRDTQEMPEASHPDVWCWLAVHLLPHFVVYRWGWPESPDPDTTPSGKAAWSRFGPDLKNGLRLAKYRIAVYGRELTLRASEQEFQSLQNRPAYGRDRRVARLIMQTLIAACDDSASCYGRNGGTRSIDADIVCSELRLINSMRPFSFLTDSEVERITADAIERLPELRLRYRVSAGEA